MEAEHHAPPLADYEDLDALLARPEISRNYPSRHSASWFIRNQRARLVESAAMIIVGGRWRFHPQRFSQVVVEVGQRTAGRVR